MTVNAPKSWTESGRRITSEFQQFGLRPLDENEVPRRCNGCGVDPPTAFLTVYGSGKFDPTAAEAGERLTVNTDNDGFFLASRNSDDAVLAWKYAENSWATVRGRTTITSERDRMLELARALQPTVFTKIHVPLSIPDVPASMPLAEISVDRGEYGTTLLFAKCGGTDIGGIPACVGEADSMRVQIWPADGYSGIIQEQKSVPMRIGGREGLYEAGAKTAAVQVQPGMLVVFELSASPSEAKEILATVGWASDPGDEGTWLPVSDWARVN